MTTCFVPNSTNSGLYLRSSKLRGNWHQLIFPVLLAMIVGGARPAIASSVKPCDEAALMAAMNGGGTVTFDCDGTIVLTNTVIIDHDTVLDASGHDVVISGNSTVRLFQVNSGVRFTAKTLTMADGLHQGANGTSGVPGGDGFGAGILNLGGTVNLIGCVLTNHLAQGG